MENQNKAVIYTLKSGIKYNVRRQIQKIACHILGNKIMTKIYYRIIMHGKLHLNSPILFSEKICWYKLFYCPENKKIIDCADKYWVREYLEGKGLSKYLPDLIGVWNKAEEIDWKSLPNKFALKCSHGCGYIAICENKELADENEIKRKLNKWIKDDFGLYNAEPHYNLSDRKIICERFIESDTMLPIDYKVHCFDGEAKVMLICSDRESGKTKLSFCDMNGVWLPYGYDEEHLIEIDAVNLQEMKRLSEMIAADFPFVRVDFYIERGKLKIGELTFDPAGGLFDYLNNHGDQEMGKMWNMDSLLVKR